MSSRTIALDLPDDTWGDIGEIADGLGVTREDVIARCVTATVRDRLRPTPDGRRRELLARLILDPRGAIPFAEVMDLIGWEPRQPEPLT